MTDKINKWLPEQGLDTNYALTHQAKPFSLPWEFLSLEYKIQSEGSWLQGLKPVSHRAKVTLLPPPSSGLPRSVLLRGELGSFVVNLSVGSHGAVVWSVAPHRDLQSLRQFLGCQLGLQLLRLNTTQRKTLTWKGRVTGNNHIIIEQNSYRC